MRKDLEDGRCSALRVQNSRCKRTGNYRRKNFNWSDSERWKDWWSWSVQRNGRFNIAGITRGRNGWAASGECFVRVEKIAPSAPGNGKEQQHGKCVRCIATPQSPKSSMVPNVDHNLQIYDESVNQEFGLMICNLSAIAAFSRNDKSHILSRPPQRTFIPKNGLQEGNFGAYSRVSAMRRPC